MPVFVALLRAVNVGGTGKLEMADLRRLCAEAGFTRVETYIASGNVVFDADADEAAIRAALETCLATHAGKPVGVIVRSAAQMAAVLAANPFSTADPKHSYAILLNDPPPADAIDSVTGQSDEAMQLGTREIYVAYPTGMGRSKLRIPAAASGTARNMNTVEKLVEMSARA